MIRMGISLWQVISVVRTLDLDPGPGVTEVYSDGISSNNDNFVSKFTSDGKFVWGFSLSTALNDYVDSLSLDNSDNAYLTSHSGGVEAGRESITKISPDGSILDNFKWDTLGTGSIRVDSTVPVNNDTLLLSGWFKGTIDFDPGPGSMVVTSSGGKDAFLCRLSTDGNLVWLKTWGAEGDETAWDLAIDKTRKDKCGGLLWK